MEKRHRKIKKDRESGYLRVSLTTYAIWILKNVAFMLLALFVVRYALTKQPAYHWVFSSLLKENYAMIKRNPHLTFDQKMQMKLGVDYEYLYFIRQVTPENAVILYPSQKAFRKEGSPFKHEISNKLFATRFLYPRKLILESELENSPYAKQITHVAIVNGEGKNRLPYPVESDVQHAVLPVTPQ